MTYVSKLPLNVVSWTEQAFVLQRVIQRVLETVRFCYNEGHNEFYRPCIRVTRDTSFTERAFLLEWGIHQFLCVELGMEIIFAQTLLYIIYWYSYWMLCHCEVPLVRCRKFHRNYRAYKNLWKWILTKCDIRDILLECPFTYFRLSLVLHPIILQKLKGTFRWNTRIESSVGHNPFFHILSRSPSP